MKRAFTGVLMTLLAIGIIGYGAPAAPEGSTARIVFYVA